MTELEQAQVWRFHHPRVSIATGPSVCNADSQVWPCDAHKLRAEVERLRVGLLAILREHHQVCRGGYARCSVCSSVDGRWPCVTVLEARAALWRKGNEAGG